MRFRISRHVHVIDERGASHHLAPGDEVPEHLVTRITNPHVWQGEPPPHVTNPAGAAPHVPDPEQDQGQGEGDGDPAGTPEDDRASDAGARRPAKPKS